MLKRAFSSAAESGKRRGSGLYIIGSSFAIGSVYLSAAYAASMSSSFHDEVFSKTPGGEQIVKLIQNTDFNLWVEGSVSQAKQSVQIAGKGVDYLTRSASKVMEEALDVSRRAGSLFSDGLKIFGEAYVSTNSAVSEVSILQFLLGNLGFKNNYYYYRYFARKEFTLSWNRGNLSLNLGTEGGTSN